MNENDVTACPVYGGKCLASGSFCPWWTGKQCIFPAKESEHEH